MTVTIPDLSKSEAAGLTVLLAAWIVLQALKAQSPWLKRNMTKVVVVLAGVLTGAFLWVPTAYVWLAGTTITAAGILGSHAAVRKLTEKGDKVA